MLEMFIKTKSINNMLYPLPYLTYCAEILGNTYKSNIQCIFLLQKKIVRIVYGANFKDHTDVIFQELHFLKFYDLVKLKTCEVMYVRLTKHCLLT